MLKQRTSTITHIDMIWGTLKKKWKYINCNLFLNFFHSLKQYVYNKHQFLDILT